MHNGHRGKKETHAYLTTWDDKKITLMHKKKMLQKLSWYVLHYCPALVDSPFHISLGFFFATEFLLKFIYSEKATKSYEIFTLLLFYVVPVKSKVKISQNFVSFSEYMNFTVGTWFFLPIKM